MDRWRGRVALVTGASAGIGLGLVEALTKHGMKVIGCARNIEKIEVGADIDPYSQHFLTDFKIVLSYLHCKCYT